MTLSEYLATHPKWSDSQWVDYLAETVTVPFPGERYTEIGLYDALGPITAESILSKLEVAGETDALGNLKRVIRRAVRWLAPNMGGIDLGNTNTRLLIDKLVEVGVLSASEGTKIKALGEKTLRRSESLGFGVVELKHVRWSRG